MSESIQPIPPEQADLAEEQQEQGVTCPLCGTSEFVRRLLFYSYCANPVHIHKSGEPRVNTVLEFRQCVEHGVRDQCIRTVFEESAAAE